MSQAPWSAVERASELRASFDRSFAEAPRIDASRFQDLLAIRIAGDAFAFQRAEVAALLVGRKVMPLPSPSSEFLGLVGFRGLIVPVYSLRALLGYPRAENLRWAILTATAERIGLAFDQYEGYLRIPEPDLAPPERPDIVPPHVRDVALHGETARPIVNVPSILEKIKRGPLSRRPV